MKVVAPRPGRVAAFCYFVDTSLSPFFASLYSQGSWKKRTHPLQETTAQRVGHARPDSTFVVSGEKNWMVRETEVQIGTPDVEPL